MNNQWQGLREDKRQQLAEQIFHEMQEGYYQSTMDFCQEISKELDGTIHALDLTVRQKQNYD
ncbi:hypothetical protein [Bacillus tuaregi]|uniref:hypothetical protein n=1 Tax=Bacillus tuaregi TaxID=1816695 RepID=UPI0008F86059|nr:hypothetical protein [Bacillus tuaregi]